MRFVRIESDGTPAGTHVYDSTTGQELGGIQQLSLELGLKQKSRVTIVERAVIEELNVSSIQVADDEAIAVKATYDDGNFVSLRLNPERAIELAEHLLADLDGGTEGRDWVHPMPAMDVEPPQAFPVDPPWQPLATSTSSGCTCSSGCACSQVFGAESWR